MPRFSTCLLFTGQAAQAADFYVATFGGRITDTLRAGEQVISVEFELGGQPFFALNGPPSEPSIQVSVFAGCDTQAEVDRLWAALAEGGKPIQCGWITDRYGVTWQIVPTGLKALLSDPDPIRAQRAMGAMVQQVKLDLPAIERAAAGGS
jgi:predicted 3-demethylubiquinone-9 3-methyltransferase (glyoxalase superfamily)